MNRTLRALAPWDGTNRVFFDKANFALLPENDIALEMPELSVFPATERRSLRPYKGWTSKLPPALDSLRNCSGSSGAAFCQYSDGV